MRTPISLLTKTVVYWALRLIHIIGRPCYIFLIILLVFGYTTYYFLRNFIKLLLSPFEIRSGQSISKYVLNIFSYGLIILFIFYFTFWNYILADLPSADQLTSRNIEYSTRIFDRNGILLYQIYKDKNRVPIKLNEIPVEVIVATLAAEDAEFYSHPGFSLRGIGRAISLYLKKGKVTGGSTITQQLVKNALLTPEKTIQRKLKELILAMRVEQRFSKDEILEMYLNEVPYGGTAYGIREAATIYFEKPVSELNLAEAALLAGLPKSPTQLSPFGAHPEESLNRQKEVISLMLINGFITEEQASTALKEEVNVSQNKSEIKAPHFVMYIRDLLVEKYGEEMVENGGLSVVTTLDYEMQLMVEEAVANEVGQLGRFNVSNGAALVINPVSGEILAMAGSRDYFDTNNDGNVNVLTRLRQPGSSIKLVNYAYALEHGYSAASILDDSPITFNIAGSKPYTPKNYDGKFRGKLTLRQAFAESRNVPAVKVLASYGVDKMVEMGRNMGITDWSNSSDYGLSLTLGGGDVKLIDLTRAYATVANYGRRPQITSISKITDPHGQELYNNNCLKGVIRIAKASEDTSNDCRNIEVLSSQTAYILIDILKDNWARTPAFGSRSKLIIQGHPEVAVKTGTSNSLRDNVTIGFNQKYLVATWVGNNDNTPMNRVASGVTGAAPIWNRIMTQLLSNEPATEWEKPSNLYRINVCGKYEEWFSDNQPKIECVKEEEKEDQKDKKDDKPRGRPQIL